jgi:hypothetical protein
MAGNSNSGRRGQSAALKILKGNPGNRKIKPDPEVPVMPPAAITEVPEFLTQPRERLLYSRIIADYQHRRIARPADVHAYARWAVYLNRWMAAKEYLDGKAAFYSSTKIEATRYLPAPAFVDMLKLETVIGQLESKLGLTPVARHQIIRGLAAMPADFGGTTPHEHVGEVKEPKRAVTESPIGYGRMN